jgi:signal transduction histidine kinase
MQADDIDVAGYAHDISNALNGFFGNLYLAMQYCQDEKVKARLHKIAISGEMIKSLVINMRSDYDSFYTKKQKPSITLVNVTYLIKGIVSDLDDSFPHVQARFFDSPIIMTDIPKEDISRIAMNLVLNACQAVKMSFGRVMVSLEDKGSNFALLVSDTGIGPSAEVKNILTGIYDPTNEYLGTSVVASKVAKHSGSVTVDGSKISVILPKKTSLQ